MNLCEHLTLKESLIPGAMRKGCDRMSCRSEKHSRGFPKVDYSGRSARIVSEQINSTKKKKTTAKRT